MLWISLSGCIGMWPQTQPTSSLRHPSLYKRGLPPRPVWVDRHLSISSNWFLQLCPHSFWHYCQRVSDKNFWGWLAHCVSLQLILKLTLLKYPNVIAVMMITLFVVGSEKRNHFAPLFKLSPFQGLKSPRLPTLFVGSLGLLLRRSKVKSYSKLPVSSSELPK